MKDTPENENLGLPDSVRDIYLAARNAETVSEAIDALNKAALLSKRDQAIFVANLRHGFNEASKKTVMVATPLDPKNLKSGFHVIFKEPR